RSNSKRGISTSYATCATWAPKTPACGARTTWTSCANIARATSRSFGATSIRSSRSPERVSSRSPNTKRDRMDIEKTDAWRAALEDALKCGTRIVRLELTNEQRLAHEASIQATIMSKAKAQALLTQRPSFEWWSMA